MPVFGSRRRRFCVSERASIRRTISSTLGCVGRALLLSIAALAIGACDGGGFRLTVDVKTDIRPGIEFTAVRTTLNDGGGEIGQDETRSAFTRDDFLRGMRVAEFDDVLSGPTRVRVQLLKPDGSVLVERTTLVTITGTTSITVLITSDCIDVECPLEGDAAGLTECLAGRCVSPECLVENPTECPEPECSADGECPSAIACAEGACINGFCFGSTNDALCRAGEYCDPDVGCAPIPMTALDGGMPDGGACVPGAPCTTERACEIGTTDCVDGAAVCVASGVATAGTTCRSMAGECDAAEVCDGTSPLCPADGFAGAGVACSAGICDGLGGCAPCTPGAACSTGNPCEIGAIECGAGGASCVSAGPGGAGTVCRAAIDVCDAEERCTGTSTTCPTDGFAPASTECRAALGPCDVAERCTGSTVACPVDGVATSATECRGASGPCDVAERCDGSSVGCPGDALASAGTTCRAASGACDVLEACDGTSAACPTDRFVAGGMQCRARAGVCDVAESCTGSSGACPANVFVSGTVCRTSAGACDVAETCSGSQAACPSDAFATSGVCRPSAGVCDPAESCNGSGPACPTNAFATSGVCRAAAGACDAAESCNGSGAGCPPNGYLSGNLCRASGGACDEADYCDGSSANCGDARVAPGTVCRASAGVCDVAESCTGGVNCPANGYRSGNECRGSSGFCDPAEYCSGSSANCPSNQYEPNGTNCGGTWEELGCGPFDVDYCSNGSCVHRSGFTGSWPNCSTIGNLCGFTGQCCGQGDGWWCVSPGAVPIYGSSTNCVQCCAVGQCCRNGTPGDMCR